MQTKAFIFLLSTVAYLFGLFVYADSRTVANQRLSTELRAMDPAAAEISSLASALDAVVRESRRTVKVSPFSEIVVSQASAKLAPREDVPANSLIVRTIRTFNDDIKRAEARELAVLIEETADRYQVDPLLVTALVSQESNFYQDAVSPVGAIGLGQLMPYTAADLGVDPNDPVENLDGAVRYLAQNLDTWAHTSDPVALALASYNAGPGAVMEYGGVPPYRETQDYVHIITNRYDSLRSEHLANRELEKSSIYG